MTFAGEVLSCVESATRCSTTLIEMWQWYDEGFPIAVATFPPHVVETIEVDAFIDGLYELGSRGRHAVIINLVDSSPQTARVRRYLFERALEFLQDERSRNLCAEAFVVQSNIMRGAVTAYHWFTSGAVHYPMKNFKAMDAAYAWCRTHLAEGSDLSTLTG